MVRMTRATRRAWVRDNGWAQLVPHDDGAEGATMSVSLRLRHVHVLVDWDTARRCGWLSPVDKFRVSRSQQAALDEVVRLIGRVVERAFGEKRVRVETRLYHGWYRGNEPTADYRLLQGLSQRESRFGDGRVLVAPPVISDALLCGGALSRMRDTLRRREDGDDLEQKMVDTAIAADLLFLARRSIGGGGADALIVVSEDDDMLPPVIVAHHWGVFCRILRMRGSNRCLPRTAELLLPLDDLKEG